MIKDFQQIISLQSDSSTQIIDLMASNQSKVALIQKTSNLTKHSIFTSSGQLWIRLNIFTIHLAICVMNFLHYTPKFLQEHLLSFKWSTVSFNDHPENQDTTLNEEGDFTNNRNSLVKYDYPWKPPYWKQNKTFHCVAEKLPTWNSCAKLSPCQVVFCVSKTWVLFDLDNKTSWQQDYEE